MRAIVQRVKSASVSANDEIVGKINQGYFVLLGVRKGDTSKDSEFLADKLSKLRVMPDEDLKTNKSLQDTEGQVLVVSQFTLHANTKDGNRPSYFEAADPKIAKELYELFIDRLKEAGLVVETGSFGNYKNIDVKLDGPVTIIYDTNEK